jgi:hypothetical protein
MVTTDDGTDYDIQDETAASLRRYADEGVPTGGFLQAVLANDLFEAVGRADDFNGRALPEICKYVYNEMSSACWGSYEKVAAHLKRKAEQRAGQVAQKETA